MTDQVYQWLNGGLGRKVRAGRSEVERSTGTGTKAQPFITYALMHPLYAPAEECVWVPESLLEVYHVPQEGE